MGERVSDAKTCRELVRRSLTAFHIPYITITPTFSISPKYGYISGEHQYCPKCQADHDAEVAAARAAEAAGKPVKKTAEQLEAEWARVMGYFRPVKSFNKGKQSEQKERKSFREGVALESSVAAPRAVPSMSGDRMATANDR